MGNGVPGKHFIKNYLTKFLEKYKRKVIYISLNGLADIDDLNRNILFSTIGGSNLIEYGYRLLKGVSELTDEFPFMKVLKKMLIFFENTLPKSKSGKLKDKENLKKILNFDNLILILDDFERSCIPMEEFFGYIVHNYLESQKTKIILISDETKIQDKEKYNLIKEKVIGRVVPFKLDLRENFENIISYFEDKEVKNILTQNKEFILNLFERFEIKNIRTINFIFYNLQVISKGIEEKKYLDKFIENIIFFITIYSNEFKLGNFSLANKDFIEATKNLSVDSITIMLNFVNEDSSKNLNEEIKTKFINKYLISLQEIKYLNFTTIYEFILKGSLNKNQLNEEIAFFHKREEPSDFKKALDKIISYRLLDEAELQPNVDKVITFLKENQYSTYDVLFNYERLLNFIEKKLISLNEIEVEKLIIGALNRKIPTENSLFERFNMYGDFQNPKVLELGKKYSQKLESNKEIEKKEKLKSFFEDINNKSTELYRFVNSEFSYLIFNKIEMSFFENLISTYNNAQLLNFYSYIKSRYKTYTNIKDSFAQEYDNLYKLLIYVKKISINAKGIRKENLDLISNLLKEVCIILQP